MNARTTILAAALFTACSTTAQGADTFLGVETGERRFYWGLNYGSWDDVDLNQLTLVLGADVSNFLGAEIHLGKTNDFSREISPGVTGTIRTRFVAAAFVRANLRYKKTTLYVMGGYGYIDFSELSLNQWNFADSISGPAYGVGMDFYGGPHTALNVSAIRYVDDDNNTIDTINLGFVHHFDWPGLASRY